MAIPEVYPFAELGRGPRYPDWIRGLRHVSGVYIIRERRRGAIVYVGESSTDRLYATLTRHFQAWTNKYETAGVTYHREDVEVAVIIVPKTHANYLQNEFICALDPVDNRLRCDQLFDLANEDEDRSPPRGYDYDIELLMEGMAYQWPDVQDMADVPF